MTTCCTIITKSYLPYARVLGLSIRSHTPNGKLIVLLADQFHGEFDPNDEPFELVRLEELGDAPRIQRMAFSYSPYEFCCALRGHFHEYLMAATDLDRWLFLDADTRAYASLQPVAQELDGHTLLLSPHLRQPATSQQGNTSQLTDSRYLTRGIYNGGMLGIRRCAEADRFIAWFKHRLITGVAREGELAWDQGWLALTPGLFGGVKVLRHPGVNVAVWNHHERRLRRDAQGLVLADEAPLVLAHFSDLACAPLLLSGQVSAEKVLAHCRAVGDASFTILSELAVDYVAALRQHGLEQCMQWEWAFARTPDGSPVPGGIKRLYRILCRSGWRPTISPFASTAWAHQVKPTPTLNA